MNRAESAEGKIITSILDGDYTTAIEIIAGFYPHELDELEAALNLARSYVISARAFDQHQKNLPPEGDTHHAHRKGSP